MAYGRVQIVQFGVLRWRHRTLQGGAPFIPLGLHKGAVCKTVGLLTKGHSEGPGSDPLPNPAVYESRRRRWRARHRALRWDARPARARRSSRSSADQPISSVMLSVLCGAVFLAPYCPARGHRVNGGPPGRRTRSATPTIDPAAGVCGVLPAASLVSATADYDRPAPGDDRSTRHVCPAAVTGDEPIPCCSGPYQCDDYAYAPVPGVSCSPPPPVCEGGLPKGWPLRLRVAVYALQLAGSLGLRLPVA